MSIDMSTPTIRAADVKLIRRRLKLTQEQLADKVGVQHTAVHHWEAGTRKPAGPVSILLDSLRQQARNQPA